MFHSLGQRNKGHLNQRRQTKMFEIPDDDEEFWENLPLGDNLSQFTPAPENVLKSKDLSSAAPQSTEISKALMPVNTDRMSPVIPFQGHNQGIVGHGYSDSVKKIVTNRRPYSRPEMNSETVTDIFNLTQSSSESDLELSLLSHSDVECTTLEHTGNTIVEQGHLLSGRGGNSHGFPTLDRAVRSAPGNFAPQILPKSCDNINKAGRNAQNCQTGSANANRRYRELGSNVTANLSSRHVGSAVTKQIPLVRKTYRDSEEVEDDKRDSLEDKSRTRRKFPGPAGILPKLAPGQMLDSDPIKIGSPQPSKKPVPDVPIPPSQSVEDVFQEAPWQMLQKDLGEECPVILKKFSIADTVTKARQKQLPNGKVPLLFVVVDTLDIHGTDGFVVLRDKTGKMQGTAHRELLKESEYQLQLGAVLVLKQVAVISPSPRTHYLNITPSNVVNVYRSNGDGTASVSYGEHLLQLVSKVETEVTQSQTVYTPKVGQLLSLPRTPIHEVMQSPNLFQNVRSSPRTSQFTPRPGNMMPPRQTPYSPAGHTFKVPQSGPRTPRCNNQPGPPRTPQPVPFSPAIQPWTPPCQSSRPYLGHSTPAETRRPVPQNHQPLQHNQPSYQNNWQDSPGGSNQASKYTSHRPPVNTVRTNASVHVPMMSSPGCPQTSPEPMTTPVQQSKSRWTFKFKGSPSVGLPTAQVAASADTCRSNQDTRIGVREPALPAYSNQNFCSGDTNNNTVHSASLGAPCSPPNKSRRFNLPVPQIKCASDAGRQSAQCSAFSPSAALKSARCDPPLVLNTSLADRNPAEMDVDSLWHDDLTDEFLTELTAEDFP